MQYGEEADLGAQMFGIGSDRAQGLGGGVEEDVVDHSLILVSDRGESASGSVKTTWKYSV